MNYHQKNVYVTVLNSIEIKNFQVEMFAAGEVVNRLNKRDIIYTLANWCSRVLDP